MTQARLTRARRPTGRTRARAPGRTAQRRSQRGGSRIDQLIRRLPGGPAGVQRAMHWLVGSLTLVALVIAAKVLGVGAWLTEEWNGLVADAGFRVERVEVVGAERIDRLKVYDIALAQRDRSMSAVDLDALRARLLRYGWIAEARVSRRLPDTLVIDITERTPAAVWQHNRKLALIDAEGVVLDEVDVARAGDLPLVIGKGANRQSNALDALIDKAPALRPLLAGATWVGNRRWDLRFKSGELLSLPEGEEAAGAALVAFARMDGVNRLLGRGIVRFDMRDPSRFVLRLPAKGRVDTVLDDAAADGGVEPAEDADAGTAQGAAAEADDARQIGGGGGALETVAIAARGAARA